MMLPFTNGLVRTKKFDADCAFLADSHYSRQTVGSPQFMPPGETIVLRNTEGTIVFGWLRQDKRDDGQRGINCSIFRNQSGRKSSEVILEAESVAVDEWNPSRMFTYVDESKTPTIKRRGKRIVGFCFRKAGWKPLMHKNGTLYRSTKGIPVFVKLRGFGA